MLTGTRWNGLRVRAFWAGENALDHMGEELLLVVEVQEERNGRPVHEAAVVEEL